MAWPELIRTRSEGQHETFGAQVPSGEQRESMLIAALELISRMLVRAPTCVSNPKVGASAHTSMFERASSVRFVATARASVSTSRLAGGGCTHARTRNTCMRTVEPQDEIVAVDGSA